MAKPRTDTIANVLSKGDIASGHRSRENARKYLPDFKVALGLQPIHDPQLDPALEEFLIEVVLGAAWYQKRYLGANRKVWCYIALNCILVVGFPIGLVGLGTLTTSLRVAVPSQIAGILTGVLALQKTITAWYASQQRYAVWYKSASDLKTIYYAFIQSWSGKVTTSQSEFLAALTSETVAARKIIDAEQLDYYQKLALPSFDILDMLTSTKATVSSFVTSLLPGTPPTTVSVVGKNLLTTTPPAAPLPTGGGLPAGQQSDLATTTAEVSILAAGVTKPNDNPYTIVIVANPAIESPVGSGNLAADPILGSRSTFEACVQYVIASVFGKLPGQAETFMTQLEPQIRVISIFDPSLGPTAANALVGEYDPSNVVEPLQSQFTALLAQYQCNGRPIKADVAFAITASANYTRSSAYYTLDDDTGSGVSFQLDGTNFVHRYFNIHPGVVALHISSTSVVALHEFGHAASSWTNGSIKDLYVDSDMTNEPINIRVGRPVPVNFASYNGTDYQSDLVRDGLTYPLDWNSFHCSLVVPSFPAVMDDFWLASSQRPEDCKHDQITVNFLEDRIRAIMSRP